MVQKQEHDLNKGFRKLLSTRTKQARKKQSWSPWSGSLRESSLVLNKDGDRENGRGTQRATDLQKYLSKNTSSKKKDPSGLTKIKVNLFTLPNQPKAKKRKKKKKS